LQNSELVTESNNLGLHSRARLKRRADQSNKCDENSTHLESDDNLPNGRNACVINPDEVFGMHRAVAMRIFSSASSKQDGASQTAEHLFDTKPSPRTESLVASAVQRAEKIMRKINSQCVAADRESTLLAHVHQNLMANTTIRGCGELLKPLLSQISPFRGILRR
jgi:hypothetical protein